MIDGMHAKLAGINRVSKKTKLRDNTGRIDVVTVGSVR